MKIPPCCAILSLLLVSLSHASSVYLRLDKVVGTVDVSMDVPVGEAWEFVFNHVREDDTQVEKLEISYGQNTFSYPKSDLSALRRQLVIVGPATVSYGGSGDMYGYAIFERLSTVEDNLVPTSSVVIPQEPAGNVSIILESSVDGVHWVEALPGTYGSSTERRFFRVRAERQ